MELNANLLQALIGQTIVVKYGGNAMTDAHLKKQFAADIVHLKKLGAYPIVVHGGGPQINHMLDALHIKSQFIQGIRVTDNDTMSVVEMVLGGQVNKEIASLICGQGHLAVGITGKDGHFIQVKPLLMHDDNGVVIKLGQVGDITDIRLEIIHALLAANIIPVIAPLGVDALGLSYNINADVVAGKLAQKLSAKKLIMMTNISGVLNKQGELIPELNDISIAAYKEDGTLSGGMLPKIDSALEAAQSGVGAVHIIDGRLPHALITDLLTEKNIGTRIRQRP
ncbi:MAG: acetylglutamate kinase [Neisseriaceae bacterium]|nr:acetylglutamate kinase [Neisseriaceae bacterium]